MKKLDPRIKMLITAACIALVHGAFLLVFGLYKFLSMEAISSTYLLIVSSFYLAIEIASVIFARIKKYKTYLKGLFLFKLIGVIFFVIAWGVSLKNSDTTQSFFLLAFNWFSITTQPLATLISPLAHLSVFYRRGIIFVIMTYITGSTISAIKRQQDFEKRMAEKNT